MTDTRRRDGGEAVRLERRLGLANCRQKGVLRSRGRPQVSGGDERVLTMVPGSKKDAALSLLFERGGATIEDVKFFVGDEVGSSTEEDVWGQIHSALVQERMGTATITTKFEDPAKLVDAETFLCSL